MFSIRCWNCWLVNGCVWVNCRKKNGWKLVSVMLRWSWKNSSVCMNVCVIGLSWFWLNVVLFVLIMFVLRSWMWKKSMSNGLSISNCLKSRKRNWLSLSCLSVWLSCWFCCWLLYWLFNCLLRCWIVFCLWYLFRFWWFWWWFLCCFRCLVCKLC